MAKQESRVAKPGGKQESRVAKPDGKQGKGKPGWQSRTANMGMA